GSEENLLDERCNPWHLGKPLQRLERHARGLHVVTRPERSEIRRQTGQRKVKPPNGSRVSTVLRQPKSQLTGTTLPLIEINTHRPQPGCHPAIIGVHDALWSHEIPCDLGQSFGA